MEQPEEQAKEVVAKYLDSMGNGDFETATLLVNDKRFKTVETQIYNYEKYQKSTDFDKIKILSANQESDNRVQVDVQEHENIRSLIVDKEGDSWKINLGDGDPATIKALNPGMVLFATVDYYSFNMRGETTAITDDSFSVGNSESAVIKGWQTSDNLNRPTVAKVKYEIVQNGWFGWDAKSTPKIVERNIPQYSTHLWYHETFLGVPEGDNYRIRITTLTSRDGANIEGAGNVYVTNL